MPRLLSSLLLLLLSLATVITAADIPEANIIDADAGIKKSGAYTVRYSIFNSSFVPAEIASIHKITRAKNQVLINVSVTHTQDNITSLGLPAQVSGTASNLLQQQRTLEFSTISEPDATYYLAPLKHTNEEAYHFKIQVTPTGSEIPIHLNFSRTLYLSDN